MRRKFNYTGRMKILRDNIEISLKKDKNSFDAKINLDDYNLPDDSRVFIETYFHTELLRFDFGTVKNIERQQDNDLTDLGYQEQLKFRTIVTDSSGKILAMAEGIRPINDKKKNSILPIKKADIGQQIWRLDFVGVEQGPYLVLNDKLPGIENFVKTNNQFILSVFPSIIREILTRIIFIDKINNLDEPAFDWHKNWIEFIKDRISVEEIPTLDVEDDDFDGNVVNEWINRMVEKFTDSCSENWRRFLYSMSEGDIV